MDLLFSKHRPKCKAGTVACNMPIVQKPELIKVQLQSIGMLDTAMKESINGIDAAQVI